MHHEIYFFLENPDSEKATVECLCRKCHKETKVGWYYSGNLTKNEYKCKKCNEIIKQKDN